MTTRKLYYEDFFLTECIAEVVKIEKNKITLDQTVAFPEGGGQEGDRGEILLGDRSILFGNTKKGMGRILHLEGFPVIQVDTSVYHIVDEGQVVDIHPGDKVKVRIDLPHRIKTTALHSALHIVLMVATEKMPEKVSRIKGCSITDQYGRLDFHTEDRFMPEELEWINKRTNEIMEQDCMIESYHHPDEKEAWYWKCGDFICPCGGTHLRRTGEAGKAHVKRKNVGKSVDRLIVTLEDIHLNEKDYHGIS